jgi:hypothetical protein
MAKSMEIRIDRKEESRIAGSVYRHMPIGWIPACAGMTNTKPVIPASRFREGRLHEVPPHYGGINSEPGEDFGLSENPQIFTF